MSGDTHYEVLGVGPDASGDEIRAAYRRLIRQVHPDKGGSDALFRRVNEAYKTLSDAALRAAYDQELRRPQGSPEPNESTNEAPGWTRVDDTEPGECDNKDPGEAESGWSRVDDQTYSSGSASAGKRAGGYTGQSAAAQSWIGRTFAIHPAGLLVGLGLVLILLPGMLFPGGGGGSLTLLGFLVALVGIVALLGGRRVIRSASYSYMDSTFGDIDTMTGQQFELFLEALFVKGGYQVRHTGGKGDMGADLVVDKAGKVTVVQAKRSATPVGHRAVQEVVGAMAPYGATAALVVTNSTFTAHAVALGRVNGVVMWDRKVLLAEVGRHSSPGSGAQQHPAGLSGASLLSAELRAGLPVAAKAAAIVLGVVLAGLAAAAPHSRSRRRR